MLLVLALFLLVPAIAGLRVVFPVEQTILLVGPGIAVCALVSWVRGGRAWLAIVWLALSGWMLLRPLSAATPFDFLARGWAILLVTIFGVICATGGHRLFLSRALYAVAATFVFASAVVVVTDVSPMRVRRTLADELDRRIAPTQAQWRATQQTEQWQKFREEAPGTAAFFDEMYATYSRIPERTAVVFPALLALESMAALALAWSLFHRISRVRIGPPLGRLRDFRFGDQFVWGLLAGAVILLIPSLESLRGLGLNLLVFFGALYILRGLGVLAWFLGARRLAVAALTVLTLVFWPATAILSLSLGLGDTWIDWRGRPRQAT